MAIVDICLSSGTGFESAYLNQRKRQVLSTTAQQFYIVVVCNEPVEDQEGSETSYNEFVLDVDWTGYPWFAELNSSSPQTQTTTMQCGGSDVLQGYSAGLWYYGWAIAVELNSKNGVLTFDAVPYTKGTPTTLQNNGTESEPVDYVKMDVTAQTIESVNGNTTSTAQATLEIDLNTRYECAGDGAGFPDVMEYHSSKSFVVGITRDCLRTDDIFILNKESTLADGTPLLNSDLTTTGIESRHTDDLSVDDWGTQFGLWSRQIFDSSALNAIPVGKTCNLVFTAYHVWNNYTHGTKFYWTGVCVTDQVCPAPLVDVEVIGFKVVLHLRVLTDKYAAQTITIHMVDGNLKGDMVTIDGVLASSEESESKYYTFDDVVFDYPPLGTPLTFEVVGECTVTEDEGEKTYTSELVSVPVSVSAGLDAPITRIESVDGALCLDLKFRSAGSDRGPSVSTKNDGEYHQLLGREYQSVYFGGFKQRSISFDGILVDDHGISWENLSYAGICIVRFPDGRRYPVDANVQVTPNSHDLTTVSVSAEQVDWS